MNEKQNNIFDSKYVDSSRTGTVTQDKKSTMKEFLKAPIAEGDLKRYGTSKPYRSLIRAIIQHGKS